MSDRSDCDDDDDDPWKSVTPAARFIRRMLWNRSTDDTAELVVTVILGNSVIYKQVA